MSLESKIEALTQAVTALTAQLQAGNGNAHVPAPQVQAPVPVAAPAQSAPQMPAPPTFAAPAPVAAPVAPALTGVPFSDTQGLIQYVMSAYQSMGPEKGAKIGGLLQSIGCANINDVKPEQFGQLYAGIEQLKAS
jgi:hypothetical protein